MPIIVTNPIGADVRRREPTYRKSLNLRQDNSEADEIQKNEFQSRIEERKGRVEDEACDDLVIRTHTSYRKQMVGTRIKVNG